MPHHIHLPNKYHFTTTLPVRIYDINYGQHLGHDNFVTMLHEARVQYLKKLNQSEANIFGLGWIMASLTVEYKNQAFYGDILTISLHVAPISKTSVECIHLITLDKTDKEIGRAKAKLTFFDYQEQKVKRIPDEFILFLKEANIVA